MANARIQRLQLILAALTPALNSMEFWARARLTSPTGITCDGCCQHWVRDVYEHAYGLEYAQFQRDTAKEAAQAWTDSDFSLDDPNAHEVGDILYFTGPEHGPNGHVVIRIQGNQVAENSTIHWDGFDARGLRPLSAFGDPDVTVRLWKEVI